jgi:hypothetical protein
MSVQKSTKKMTFVLLLIAGSIGGASISLLVNTPKGKELYADAWLNIALGILSIGLVSFIMIKGWEKLSNRERSLWLTFLIFLTLLAVYTTSHNWQYLPWGRASAFQIADHFLVALSLGDYEGATQYMKPCVREKVGTDVLRAESQTKPVSWQFTEYERGYSSVSTIGTARLVDGSEVRIELRMRWNGLKWEVFSVIFGEPYKDAVIQFLWGC